MEIASAYVSLLPSAKGFGSKLNSQVAPEIDRAGRSGGSRYGSVFAKAGMGPLRAFGAAALAFVAVDKVKDALSFGLDVAAQNEQAQISFQTMLGSAQKAKTFIGQLQQFAAKTPFDFPGLQQSASSLISAGISAKKVIPIMTTLGDVTSGMGTGSEGIQRATIALQQMNAAGKIQAEDLNQLRDAGIPVYDLLASALGKSKSEVVGLAQSGKLGKDALDKMMKALETGKGLERFSGLMDKQSQSLTGMISTFKDTFGQDMAAAMAPMIPTIKKAIGGATTAIGVALPAISHGLASAFSAMSTFLAPVTAAIKDIVKAFKILSGGSGSVADRIDGFAEVMDHAFGNSGRLVVPIRKIVTAVHDIGKAFGILFEGGSLASRIDGFAEVMDHGFGNTGGLVAPIRSLVTAFMSFGQQAITVFRGQVVPVLQQAATTFRSVILPAIVSLVSYVATSLWPILLQVAGIIRGNVIPIIAAFASFLYGTLYPAVVRIVTAIAQNLKPVFDQLVATFRGSVLPSLQLILARFREWQPTIQRVIGVLVQVIGKVLVFAAAVLGRVLPVVIKFAGWLLTKLVPAILNTIGALARIVGAVIKVVVAFAKGVAAVVKFQIAIDKKIASAIKTIAGLPGKAVSALGDLSRTLIHSGEALIAGFAAGIRNKATAAYNEAKGVLSKVRNLFPHSPAKEGPFSGKGWTLHSGVALMTGLADGIKRSKGKVRSAIVQVLDAVRQQVQQVTSSVSQAFGGDLFSAPNAVAFVRNLTATTGMVGRLKSAFAKLMKWGWRPEALSALFQSGNSGLILSLASSQALATQAAHQYQSAQAGLSSLGATVANNQYALGQDRTLKKFDDLINAVKSVGIDVGSEINGAAKKGKKKRR